MNSFLINLSPEQLRRAADIQEEIQALSLQLKDILKPDDRPVTLTMPRSLLQSTAPANKRQKTTAQTPTHRKGFPIRNGSVKKLRSAVIEPVLLSEPAAAISETKPEVAAAEQAPLKPILSVEEVLAKVSAAIRENPQKIPSLHKYDVHEKKEYVAQVRSAIPVLNELPGDLFSQSIYLIGKNVAEDDRVRDGLVKLGVRVFGDLWSKVSEVDTPYFTLQGVLMVLCRVREIILDHIAKSSPVEAAA